MHIVYGPVSTAASQTKIKNASSFKQVEKHSKPLGSRKQTVRTMTQD